MAVQKSIIADTGIPIEHAYFRIDEYSCNQNNEIHARIRAYVSRDAQKEGKSFIEGSEFIVTMIGDYSDEGVNTKRQIYEHIKTIPEFSDAIDV